MTIIHKLTYIRNQRTSQMIKGASPLTPQYLDRQSRIANLAYMHFHDSDQAISFLNEHNLNLAAKPLDLAGDSNEGYAAVCGEILRQVPISHQHNSTQAERARCTECSAPV
ncbi:hypothetical protein FHW96_002642 [Novosphingobium sp. SG751A]|uniref:hypothetical protein n=1 Tax=Novosphingobium sp. SG751A TaxID=2587000 RepID=UPI0015534C37|nr:hypothetical protein [Novosphingobium sp. SG751A]NOW46482.1 hypothetical protein [Novosphingobium sp. SG751A]